MAEQQPFYTGVVRELSEGQRVEVLAGGKTRSLTVDKEAEYLEREPYRCNGWRVWLTGYGTRYTIEVPDEDGKPAVLLYPSSSALGEIIRELDVPGTDVPWIVAEHTAADLGISER